MLCSSQPCWYSWQQATGMLPLRSVMRCPPSPTIHLHFHSSFAPLKSSSFNWTARVIMPVSYKGRTPAHAVDVLRKHIDRRRETGYFTVEKYRWTRSWRGTNPLGVMCIYIYIYMHACALPLTAMCIYIYAQNINKCLPHWSAKLNKRLRGKSLPIE